MKHKKKLVGAAALLAAAALCLYVFVQSRFIRTYTCTELDYRGYSMQEVEKIEVKHSFLNGILSYDPWRISVEFTKMPEVLFLFTYRDGKILFRGVSAEPLPDKETEQDYCERYKNGTLLGQ